MRLSDSETARSLQGFDKVMLNTLVFLQHQRTIDRVNDNRHTLLGFYEDLPATAEGLG